MAREKRCLSFDDAKLDGKHVYLEAEMNEETLSFSFRVDGNTYHLDIKDEELQQLKKFISF